MIISLENLEHFLTTQRIKNTRLKTQHKKTKPNQTKTNPNKTKQQKTKPNQTKYKTIQNQTKCLKKTQATYQDSTSPYHTFYPRYPRPPELRPYQLQWSQAPHWRPSKVRSGSLSAGSFWEMMIARVEELSSKKYI